MNETGMKVRFSAATAQKADEAIHDNIFLRKRMIPEYSNTWLVKTGMIRDNEEGEEFIETLIDHLTSWGIERTEYEFDTPSR